MKAKFASNYKKADNNGGYRNVFVYTISGTQDEIASYQDAAGVNYRENENGQPLFFSNTFAGTTVSLIQTQAGRYIIDTAAFAQAEGMLTNFANAEMRAALAGILAKQFLGVKDTAEASAE